MNIRSINNTIVIMLLGLIAIVGSNGIVSAQDRKKPEKKPPLVQPKTTEPDPVRQKVYVQQQTQNQQRYDQRSQTYQQGQQKWTVQKQQIQQTVTAKPDQTRKPIVRDQNIQMTQAQLRLLNEQNQRNQMVSKQKRVNKNDLVKITERQKQWHQSEQNWQSAYNSRWANQQNLFDRRENQLRQQNRRQHLAFQQAYWERVREDQMRLQRWTFYDDVGLQYGYSRGGQYYYTSQYGMNMVRDAINDGYQEGFLAGQSDREDGWRSDYRDPLAYQDASFGYNGYWIGLDEYQYYFREGFRRGYEDGYYGRYRYGRNENGGYLILDVILAGIVTFAAIVD
jgi:hypothetical protein